MSSTLDDRVVQMEFNNSSFEKNVGTSIKSLQDLDKALQLKDASKGLGNVMTAVRAVDLSQMASGIENISGKFNIMGAIGLSVINKLTSALMGFAGSSVNAFMDPLIEGGKRRAQNIEQAKFMIKGLGKSWDKLNKDMDYAVSGTAFGIDQAAKAASQLSASGITAGKNMKTYLRGISGVAAMTGSSYDEIARVFTKVAGGGRVMAQELNQISDRGLNAAKTLADYYNKVHKGAKLTEQDIRKMASEGKISADMFAKAMDSAYGAQATKANELYSGSLSNVNAALSRIGEAFVTPVFEKQRNIFNQLRLVINGVAKALGPFVKLWGEVQKSSGESWVGVLKEMEKAIGFLSNSSNTVYNQQIAAYEKYLKDVAKAESKGKKKPKKTDEIKAGEANFKAREKLINAEIAAEKKLDKAKKKYKDNETKKNKKALNKAQKNFDAAKKAAATVQEQTDFTRSISAVTLGLRVLWKTSKTVFTTIQDAWKQAFPAKVGGQSLLLTLAEAFKTFAYWLMPTTKQLETFKGVLVGFFTVLRLAFTVVSNVFQAIPAIFQVVIGLFKVLGAVLKPVIDFASQLASSFLGMFKGVGEGVDVVQAVGDALTWLRTNGVEKLLSILGNATTAITEFWNGFGDGGGGNLFAGFDPFIGMLERLQSFGATMSEFFQNAWIWAKGIQKSIKDAMGNFGSGAGGFFSGLKTTIQQIGAFLGQLFSDVKGGLSKVFEGFDWSTLLAGLSSGVFIAMLVKVVKGIMEFFKVATQAKDFMDLLKSGIIDGIKSLGGALDRFGKDTKSDVILKISTALKQFAIAIAILAAAFWLLSKVDIENVSSAVAGMITATTALVGGLLAMSKVAGNKDVMKMPAIALALMLLGASLVLFAKAIQILSGVDPERLLPSMGAFAGGLLLMVGALEVLAEDPKKFTSAAFAMGLLAGAMYIMAGAVAILGAMPLEMLIQGGIAFAGIIALMTLFAAFPSENALKAGLAMDAMAVAILLMTGAIAILGSMPIPMIQQGGLVLLGLMTALVIAANLMRTAVTGAGAMIAMAVAIAILIIPIREFGEMDAAKLEQGIVAVLILAAGLVLAASLVEKAAAGAAAFIVLSIAVVILSAAVWMLAQLPADQVQGAVIAIGGALAVLLLAAAGAQVVSAGLFILAGAILAIGLAVALAGAGVLMFAIGLAGMGGALFAVIPGLTAFGQAASAMVPNLLPMVGLAAALGALGVAVGLLGAAFILLGVGLIAVGAGMALLAAFGGVGAIAVLALWKALEPLVWQVLQIGALGGAFLALGAGLLALGAGLAITAVGLLAISLGLIAIVGSGFATVALIDSLRMGLERFVPLVPQLQTMGSGLDRFGGSVQSLRTSLQGVAGALSNATIGFDKFGLGVDTLSVGLGKIPAAISRTNQVAQTQLNLLTMMFKLTAVGLSLAVGQLSTEVQNGSVSLNQSWVKMVSDVAAFAKGISSSAPTAIVAVTFLLTAVSLVLKNQLSNMGNTGHKQGKDVGKNVGSGIVKGLDGQHDAVYKAAKRLANKLIKGIKDELQIQSPSKVMERLGKYVKEGFYKGLTGFEDAPVHRVMEAVNTLKDELKDTIAEAQSEAKDVNAQIKKLSKKKKKTKKDKSNLKELKAERKELNNIEERAKKAQKQLDNALKIHRTNLMKVSDEYDKVVDELKEREQDLKDAQKALLDAQVSYKEQFNKLPEFSEDGDLVNNYVESLQKQIDATKKFAKDLAQVRKLGLDDKMYAKILEQGLDAQPFLDALIESGKAGVTEINKLHKNLDSAAGSLGNTAGKELYQAGVNTAQGLVDGLKKKEKELKAQMEKLGNIIVDTVRKTLNIKSPSRVMAGIGGYTMLGLMEGLQKYIPALEQTSEDIGDTAIDGLRKAIDEIGETVYGEMDMTPVIRPVLDLTDVENSAKTLSGVFGSRSIDVGSTYASASDIALATRAKQLLAEQNDGTLGVGDSVTFIQNNNSPKAISTVDLYRQTRNQLSGIKKRSY